MRNKKVRSLVETGVLLSLSLVLSYFESLISINIGIPMMKIGISNVVLTFVLYRYGFGKTLIFGSAKSILALVFTGRLSSIIYSLTGMLLAVVGMWLTKKTKLFSPLGVNVTGAVFHIWGQLFAASIVFENYGVFSIAPILTAFAVLSGILTYIPLVFVLKNRNTAGE